MPKVSLAAKELGVFKEHKEIKAADVQWHGKGGQRPDHTEMCGL